MYVAVKADLSTPVTISSFVLSAEIEITDVSFVDANGIGKYRFLDCEYVVPYISTILSRLLILCKIDLLVAFGKVPKLIVFL